MNINSFGPGVWGGKWYILESCPICGDEWSFRFLASSGLWICNSCGKDGTELAQLQQYVNFDIGTIDDPDGVISFGRYSHKTTPTFIPTGYSKLDNALGGFIEGGVTVLSGKRGEGKSVFSMQTAANVVNFGIPVCYYSGEQTTDTFIDWFSQIAAGPYNVEKYDMNGGTHYRAKKSAEEAIKKWVGDRLIMYDNSIVKSSERNSILERFNASHSFYGCRYFVIDNLMTAKYTDSEKDFYRQQSNYVRELMEFSIQTNSHVMLIAHPKKADGTKADDNEMVAGSSDITNLATNVLRIDRVKEDDKNKPEADSTLKIMKNRQFGTLGTILMDYEETTRRLIQQNGTQITRYGWEN